MPRTPAQKYNLVATGSRQKTHCINHLEHMECFELYVLALIPKKVHHHLQVGLVGDIPRHHVEVGPIEEDLTEELERLSFGDIVVGENQRCKRGKELVGMSVSMGSISMSHRTYPIVVLVQIICDHRFVPRQRLFEISKCVARDSKRRGLDIMREFIEPALVSNVTNRMKG